MSKGDLSCTSVSFGGLGGGGWFTMLKKKLPCTHDPFHQSQRFFGSPPVEKPLEEENQFEIWSFSGGKVVQDLIFFVHEHSLCCWFQAECFMLFITGSGGNSKHNKQQQRQATTTAATATSANEVLGFVNLWILDSVFHFYNNKTSFYLPVSITKMKKKKKVRTTQLHIGLQACRGPPNHFPKSKGCNPFLACLS